jgi:hypothetical protein
MRNYALQKGPCNFLNLRTSPWKIPFLLLLCFSSLCSSFIRFPSSFTGGTSSWELLPASLLLRAWAGVDLSKRRRAARASLRRRRRHVGASGAGAARASGPERVRLLRAVPHGRGSCGRTNLNYTGSSTRVHSRGLQRASNGIIPWLVG